MKLFVEAIRVLAVLPNPRDVKWELVLAGLCILAVLPISHMIEMKSSSKTREIVGNAATNLRDKNDVGKIKLYIMVFLCNCVYSYIIYNFCEFFFLWRWGERRMWGKNISKRGAVVIVEELWKVGQFNDKS